MQRVLCFAISLSALMLSVDPASGQEPLKFQLQFQQETSPGSGSFETKSRPEAWNPAKTAIIVCDTWDLHHCLNAVRRLEQMVPRLNEVIGAARERGVTIIHAPSDCMEFYRDHAARQRAVQAPVAEYVPPDVKSWCSIIPAEERAIYPIDQSDGGEDDDPAEHAQWAKKLAAMGRNPATPWKRQSAGITIAPDKDYISDRGDEVWNVLQHRQIDNVILVGVHTNMCVLGRPFGLRQMVRNGKNVVLMRDMTDTMYNPKRWPYVSHFEGTRRVIAHIERYVCPTITSDQIIGGTVFRFAGDSGAEASVEPRSSDFRQHWTTVPVPHLAPEGGDRQPSESVWYRCVVRLPRQWLKNKLVLAFPNEMTDVRVWCNGRELERDRSQLPPSFVLAGDAVEADDANLLVVRLQPGKSRSLTAAPTLVSGKHRLHLAGRWQYRIGADPALSSMPLPAKFGGSADIVFSPQDPLWTPRPLTRVGEFTPGIEGPACDADGNVFAVNFQRQGTIGRVRPNGVGELWVELPGESIGNGIRFAPDGTFFVADYTQHNVLRVDPDKRQVTVHAHHPEMNQPNDLAITPDGKTLFASDPNWAEGTGQLWRIDHDGAVTALARDMGTTNGIEVSPDGKTLYVNESKQRNIWAFDIREDRTIANKRLVRKFQDHGFDGMRCDVDGNLYVTRHGKGTVVKLSPDGRILKEVAVLGTKPSNLCFGGPDGRTVYVTEVDSTRLVSFRVDRPGRSWAEQHSPATSSAR
ncbi:MAG: isochorismatase family protein [Pirellulales bacterium]|nr:isochorismatase family protein [Pirellulales bacterium]